MTTYSHRLRVYWEDTDAGGVVFYANYLKFFERARTEWLRALGFSQQALAQSPGVLFVVVETHVDHLSPARLDDEIDVSVDVAKLGGASLVLNQQATRVATALQPSVALARGSITVGCVHAHSFKPCRLPTSLTSRLNAS
jgi:acyl-CoA thioester hydrolase